MDTPTPETHCIDCGDTGALPFDGDPVCPGCRLVRIENGASDPAYCDVCQARPVRRPGTCTPCLERIHGLQDAYWTDVAHAHHFEPEN